MYKIAFIGSYLLFFFQKKKKAEIVHTSLTPTALAVHILSGTAIPTSWPRNL